ncbi:MAG: hypothetical protein QW648_00050 [Nanoarchaeales archaeon]
MNRKEKIIINLLFLIFTIPIISLIIYGYGQVKKIIQRNPMNPLGLEMIDCILEEAKITFIISNPNNSSYSIVFTNLRIRGSYSSPAIITSGGFLNKIRELPASSDILLVYPVSDVQVQNIIRTWKKLGGNITLSLDYEIVHFGIGGVLICTK